MAKCDLGYLCDVCGNAVDNIVDSDLYLRYIMGEVAVESLHLESERHLSCNPMLTQYIVHKYFTPVEVTGPFDKRELDNHFVQQQEELITNAWVRLQQVRDLGIPIEKYPLSEAEE